ncbi:diphosphomevalonate decarboxylase [Ligilactobacillus pabuli]|uniref:diphosphomevalonate decarboxylase n=1 Tax=Ligilactobacillus pabuli TaxID=2886039 RepID=A0ABQ5JI68_9LACO|nr:diphosphomevalonate decarboxylase [Ligilactobacillus pabuli]GKS80381.1 diphosphomevalonate decarboxylase [Ligilactobacillus pabuli]HIW89905.1 diphosphomevalonate decarboxylase [Candidatus Ligilactobacillus excrementipullorum]
MQNSAVTARAHTNIALIKYWGKKDQQLILPMNGSLSLTLDKFYTDTSVEYLPNLNADVFYLNGTEVADPKITRFMDIVRQKTRSSNYALIKSTNHVPTAAGLASSASAYAALALAATAAAGQNFSLTELSRLARRGSGSATRSIFGGFAEWLPGTDDQSSYAQPLDFQTDWDLRMIAIVVDALPKKVSSRHGMQTVVETSPFYPAWIKSATQDLAAIKQAMQNNDFQRFGEIAESNALRMHALNLSAVPHFNYFEPQSLIAMQAVENLRAAGISCYYTMDAGPNVKVICKNKDLDVILDKLHHYFPSDHLLVAAAGPNVKLL